MQIPLDFDISYVCKGKTKHMKEEWAKYRHKCVIVENILNNKYFLPYSITETHNGEQAYIAFDKKYIICNELEGKIREKNDWMTREGYKNLVEVVIDFVKKYIDKHVDANVKHLTQIMRQDMCLHYKKDNKIISINKIIYAAELGDVSRKYSPEKILDIIEKECLKNNKLFLAKKAATAKQLLRRNILLKEIIKEDNTKTTAHKIAKKHRFIDCISKSSHDDFRRLVESVREHEGYSDYLTDKFMSNKKLTYELNRFPIELYLDKNEDGSIATNNTDSFCSPISIFYKNECRILNDTGSNTSTNILNLFADIAKMSNKGFLQFVRESLNINYSYEGEGERLAKTAKKLDWNIQRIESLLKKSKGKEKKYLTLAMKYMTFLKNAIVENVGYRYNQLFKNDYVIMNYNLLTMFVKANTHRNTKFNNDNIGYIIIKSLAMLGVLNIYYGNRNAKYVSSIGTQHNRCTLLKINELSEKSILMNIKTIIEKEECSHNKATSVFTNDIKYDYLEKKYGVLAKSCKAVLAKEKMLSRIGVKASHSEEETEFDVLTNEERDVCTKIRYVILGSFVKHLSIENMTKDQLLKLYHNYQSWSLSCLNLYKIEHMNIVMKNIAVFTFNVFLEAMNEFMEKEKKPKMDYSNWVYRSNVCTRKVNKIESKKIIKEMYCKRMIGEYDRFIENNCPIPLQFIDVNKNFIAA